MAITYHKADPNPSTKFFFNDDTPEEGFILVRAIPPVELDRIRKLCSKKHPPEYRRGIRYEIPDEVNETRQTEMMWDYIVTGWEGIVDDDGKPVPCTTEKKIEFMQKWPWFSSVVADALERLNTIIKTRTQDDEAKNS